MPAQDPMKKNGKIIPPTNPKADEIPNASALKNIVKASKLTSNIRSDEAGFGHPLVIASTVCN